MRQSIEPSRPAAKRQQQMRRRRQGVALALLSAAYGAVVARKTFNFVAPGTHAGAVGHINAIVNRAGRSSKGGVAMHAYQEMSASAGLAAFQGSEASLWTGLGVVLISLPGVWSTIQRTGQAKYVEKTYMMAGPKGGGLEMRAIAGGVVAYFKSLNYNMEDSPQEGRIRFVGNLQGSVSQALYLTGVLLGTLIAVGFVLQALFPDGPLGLGPNAWYSPAVLSPWAGWFYWGRAFRKDIVELQLEMADDSMTTTLSALGDKETIETMQKGVRFQSPEGQLFQLMEKGMEYQPGIFDEGTPQVVVYKDKERETKTQPVAESVA